jgi:AGCS family alanine or glycine:cation symporter
MYALERGLQIKSLGKVLGVLFAIFTGIACFGIGNLVQINAITVNFNATFGAPNAAIGLTLMVLTFIVIVGGIKSIAKFAQYSQPFIITVFFLCCLYLLIANGAYIGAALVLICKSAFSMQAITGGVLGFTVTQAARFGIARGLFSNEAGLGSSPIAAAAATTRNPVRQGLVSMSQVFWDTIVLCAVTGTMYVTCVIRWPDQFIEMGDAGPKIIGGGTLAAQAFSNIPGGFGPYLLAFCILAFAWTTVLGWGYYGERAIEYLFGKKALMPFKIIYSLAVFIGSVTALNLVWDIADMFNAFMAIPNLICLLALSGILFNTTKHYLWEKKLDDVDTDPILEIKN